ncbi:membrane protein [Rugosimonospora africana]|uniref:Membrane protein n=2 Tax=Rugosimonospora africana TaxID=556532 RepID=A0A8J3QXA0_9ACTN|nr:membrane protein [Rugosimonospora africana]
MQEDGRQDRAPERSNARDGRDETPMERWDRNLGELLQELRVAQTGVQILFAFLLTLPFTNRFGEIGWLDRDAYLATLMASATASALLITPVSYHRLVFRSGLKPQLVRTASVVAQAGLVFLLLALAGAVFVVVDVVSGARVAAALAAVMAALYIALWYVVPLVHRSRR